MVQTTLTQRVNTWINSREKSGAVGLELIVAAIEQIAARDENGDPVRNWDPFARLYGHFRRYGRSKASDGKNEFNGSLKVSGTGAYEGLIRLYLRAAFGSGKGAQVKLKTVGVTHPSGVEIEFTQHIPDGPKGAPVLSNHWGLVKQALEKRYEFDNKALITSLRRQLGEDDAMRRQTQLFSDEKAQSMADRIVKKLKDENYSVERFLVTVAATYHKATGQKINIGQVLNPAGAMIEDIDAHERTGTDG